MTTRARNSPSIRGGGGARSVVVVSEAGVWRSSVTGSVAGVATIRRRQGATGGPMHRAMRPVIESGELVVAGEKLISEEDKG